MHWFQKSEQETFRTGAGSIHVHGIGKALTGVEFHHGLPGPNSQEPETQKPADESGEFFPCGACATGWPARVLRMNNVPS